MAERKPTDLFLVQRKGATIHRAIRLHEGEAIVGRSSRSDIVLEGDAISRNHARLHVASDHVEVEDLESRNGTFIDEVRVTRATLSLNQMIRFGSARFVLTHHPLDENPDASDESTRSIFQVALTPARLKVFKLLLTDLPEKQFPKQLGRSIHTIHNHIREIYRIFGVHSRRELLLKVYGPPEDP